VSSYEKAPHSHSHGRESGPAGIHRRADRGVRALGHAVRKVGVKTDLQPLDDALVDFDPHICFNLLEDFAGHVTRDQHVVSYLELLNRPYTGCNPRGLTLARDKALTKKILTFHGIAVPRFQVFPLNRSPKKTDDLPYPLFVKSLTEEGSTGISQASLVTTDTQLVERVEFIHKTLGTDAIAEQYIDGRELYVSLLGNRQLQLFPIWELDFANLPPEVARIATKKVKFDTAYQKRHGIISRPATDLSPQLESRILDICKQSYRALELSGYARIDLRLTSDNEIYLLEANPNPQIARSEDFSDSAAASGYNYETLLQKIVSLGLYYQPLGIAA
jgi:D-alanine-D-alanine ligase